MTAGTIGILNVGAGDNKLVFDPNDPAGMIRAARIVTDMLRRGYALLVEVPDGKGGKAHQRVREFREDTFEYIIADFDPVQAERVDAVEELKNGQGITGKVATPAGEKAKGGKADAGKGGRRVGTRAIKAAGSSGVAVARTAGG